MTNLLPKYDIIVVGAGHAGCEANGEAAAETGHHLPGCGAEVAGTAVIAEPLPQPQHLVLRG